MGFYRWLLDRLVRQHHAKLYPFQKLSQFRGSSLTTLTLSRGFFVFF